ncbi:hypothetical protein [Sutcliffiella rhizosphaerae]|uniref:Type IV pilus assembly protein PilN n=1 Tax=Sutcliffiella rhizosphaerae TaxID=2880967 RepID=A0ABN8A6Y5_9BACI|nr:hypothetical protein [Sutcliffiella rhizosphaerae]CAG9619506.1 hypothetical protein BACCIP111883_00273 [Sutcliffiella rhizosphaerae]
MLVNIDLLPKKRARNITAPLVYGICGFFVLTVSVALFYFYHLVNNDVKTAEQELATVQELRFAQEAALNNPEGGSSSKRLQDTVLWAEEYPLEMVPIMQDLIRLLPDRGFIQRFSYDETGILNLSVQFDESKDAAYFLYHLNESPLYHSIELSSIATVSMETETTTGILPRYVGQYNLGFDRSKFQSSEEAEESVEDVGGEDE